MQKILCFALTVCLIDMAWAQKKPTKFANTILAKDLERHLSVIAHDSLEGRGTGTPGQQKAARYIANHFKQIGLKPVAKDGSYFQPVELVKSSWKDVYLEVNGQRKEFYKDFYLAGSKSITQPQAAEVVFAGYGIKADGYDDFKNVDVSNKIVVVLAGEPKTEQGKYLLSGTEKPSDWSDRSGTQRKQQLLAERGAICSITVPTRSDTEQEETFTRMKAFAPRLNQLLFKNDPNRGRSPLQVTVKGSLIKEVFGLNDQQLADLVAGKMTSGSLKGQMTIKAERAEEDVETANVLGLVEGTDKKDEIVVITAHYDHIGIVDGQINNGANDDGSGTVSVMEIAEAFAKAKAKGKGPRRSMLFMTVTGEERGLLGSAYYTDHPIFPLENTVADLNIDMVGRTDKAHEGKPDYIYVVGSDKLSSELHAINEAANQQYTKLELDYKYNDPKDPERIYYRSDHYNFAKHKIPVAFFYNGNHPDYHRPTDDIEKIQFDKAEKVARLVFYTAWELANREKRIVVDSNKP